MPAAKGLFHRAAVQSGAGLRMVTKEYSTRLAAATLTELGLSGAQVDQLHAMPHARLLAAAQAAQRKLAAGPAAGPGGLPRFVVTDRVGLAAVVDGTHLPHHPFDPAAPAVSAQVPMLIGTTLNEFANEIQTEGIEALTAQDLRTRATAVYGDQATKVLDAYTKAMPGARPSDVFSRISAAGQRFNAIEQATRKQAQRAAPAFLYWFTWQTPILDGRPRAFHCAELPFVFNNAERCAAMTGATAEAIDLAHRVSDAWIAFARSGDPNHAGLPTWPAFEPAAGPVMVFDRTCAVKNDPDRVERSAIPTT
jgi:para-nitrobenzyl esterase